jgi:hypothetical protein
MDAPVKVCSMVHVGDTLWVGRNCGDILIVNVGQRNSFQYCEVIAILKVSSSAQVMTSPFLDPVLLNDTTEFPVDKSTLTSLPKSGADDETFNIAITSQYWKEFL